MLALLASATVAPPTPSKPLHLLHRTYRETQGAKRQMGQGSTTHTRGCKLSPRRRPFPSNVHHRHQHCQQGVLSTRPRAVHPWTKRPYLREAKASYWETKSKGLVSSHTQIVHPKKRKSKGQHKSNALFRANLNCPFLLLPFPRMPPTLHHSKTHRLVVTHIKILRTAHFMN